MNELKYCKFCNKEKPIKEFCKSGCFIKNICRECQNQKQTQIYRNSKKVKELQQENKQLKDNWNILKEYIDTLWLDNKGIITKIKDKIELIEQGSDSDVKD